MNGDRKVRSVLFGLLAVAALLVSNVSSAQSDSSLATIKKNGYITIANTQDDPPWSQLDANNQPAGFDVDVAREVAKRIGVPKVVFIADTFTNFVDGLRTHKYDIVVNSMAATAERRKIVDFSVPYAPQEFRLWVNERNSDIHEASDLPHKNIGVIAGTSNEVYARAHFTSSTIHNYDNAGFMYNDLATGRIDAVMEAHFSALKEKTVNHLPIKEVGKPVTISLGSIAVPKNEPSLLDAINKSIAGMIADGTLEKIGHKWFGADYDVVDDIHRGSSL